MAKQTIFDNRKSLELWVGDVWKIRYIFVKRDWHFCFNMTVSVMITVLFNCRTGCPVFHTFVIYLSYVRLRFPLSYPTLMFLICEIMIIKLNAIRQSSKSKRACNKVIFYFLLTPKIVSIIKY